MAALSSCSTTLRSSPLISVTSSSTTALSTTQASTKRRAVGGVSTSDTPNPSLIETNIFTTIEALEIHMRGFFSFQDLISTSMSSKKNFFIIKSHFHRMAQQEKLYEFYRQADHINKVSKILLERIDSRSITQPNLSPTRLYLQWSSIPMAIAYRYQSKHLKTEISNTSHPITNDAPSSCVLHPTSITINSHSPPKTYDFDLPLDFKSMKWTVLGHNDHYVALLQGPIEDEKCKSITPECIEVPPEYIRIVHLQDQKACLQSLYLEAYYYKPDMILELAKVDKIYWISNSQLVCTTNAGLICLFNLDQPSTDKVLKPMAILDHYNGFPAFGRTAIPMIYDKEYLVSYTHYETHIWNLKAIGAVKDLNLLSSHDLMQSHQLLRTIFVAKAFNIRRTITQAFKFPILVTCERQKESTLIFTNILKDKALHQLILPDIHTSRARIVQLYFNGMTAICKQDSIEYAVSPGYDIRHVVTATA